VRLTRIEFEHGDVSFQTEIDSVNSGNRLERLPERGQIVRLQLVNGYNGGLGAHTADLTLKLARISSKRNACRQLQQTKKNTKKKIALRKKLLDR